MSWCFRQASLCATLLLLLPLAATALAAGNSYELTVHAGKHDRTNTPVTVLTVVPGEAKSVTLTDLESNKLAAQLTQPGLLNESANGSPSETPPTVRELHFILPSLKKSQSIKLTATFSADTADQGFAWKDAPGQYAELSYAGRPVLRYMCKALDPSKREETYKVFHHLYNPAGTQLVTKGPGGLYSHHRGLFFGFSCCSYQGAPRVDTWHCGGNAHQSHEGFLAEESGPVLGRHQVAVDWHGPGEKLFAKERREMTVYNVPDGLLVKFATRLSSTVGKLRLDGDPQHAGFQFRAAQEVAEKNQGLTYYLRPDGKGKMGATRNWPGNKDFVNLPWNALSFVIGDRRYTAVYLDKPTNPKQARYSERSYGRFGSYFEYELDEGKDLVLNYRVWLTDGEMTVEQAAALSADFVDPVEVTVE